MALSFANIAFTPSVRAKQSEMGSAEGYSGFLRDERQGGKVLGQDEADFITARDGFYLATVSETGWPYVQFRGGTPGFVKVVNNTTIAYADVRGNRQYISTGNLTQNNRVSLILMDYPNQRRLKLWGVAKAIPANQNPSLAEYLTPVGIREKVEHAVVIQIEAIDWNCPRHIPKRLTATEWQVVLGPLQQRLSALEEENQRLRLDMADTRP